MCQRVHLDIRYIRIEGKKNCHVCSRTEPLRVTCPRGPRGRGNESFIAWAGAVNSKVNPPSSETRLQNTFQKYLQPSYTHTHTHTHKSTLNKKFSKLQPGKKMWNRAWEKCILYTLFLHSPAHRRQSQEKQLLEKRNNLVAVWKRNCFSITGIPKGKRGPRNNHFTVRLQYDVRPERNTFVNQTAATVYHVCHYCWIWGNILHKAAEETQNHPAEIQIFTINYS